MEEFKKIQQQLKTGYSIKEEINNHYEVIRRMNCDKNGLGFNLDSRYSSGKVTISIDSWRGTYGSSSCYTTPIIKNNDIFKKFFMEVLEGKFKELMFETADRIIEDAKNNKNKAIEEISAHLQELKEL